MKEQEKKAYLESYQEAKKKGVPFFPDILFKDAVVSLIIFLALVALAYFVGAPLEERANPADTSYTPRPEWYFIFLFQLLKYFPGELEVFGVIVLPTLGILLLITLPFLDRSARRHPRSRPVIIGVTALAMAGIIFLSIQSIRETPPPAETTGGDKTAALYTKNCAPCHGPTLFVPEGTNLSDVIAQGKHEGMPAWSVDLIAAEIDALVGFILSPAGSDLFTENCSTCHEVAELIAGDPLELKTALDQGTGYPPHADVEIPEWADLLSTEENTALLNFLVAPDGQRLFAVNCAPCHGRSVPFSENEEGLRTVIIEGGMHLEMPSWREMLNEDELRVLASYVTDPASAPDGEALFQSYCTDCHGERVPQAADKTQAVDVIASGGAHQTMPVWGDVLTEEQIEALVNYALVAASGTPLEVGQKLYVQNCAICHGNFGEGGQNPVQPGDIIAPISSAEYLKTRDDFTLRSIIAQGQPNFGMSPFGSAFGGPLDEDEVDAIVAFLRSWEQDPPVEIPPEIIFDTLSLTDSEIYMGICAQCHGANGEGLVGPSLIDPQYQNTNSDQDIFDSINLGHEATAMIGWGEILNAEQIQQLVDHIRTLGQQGVDLPIPTPTEPPTFTADVLPIFEESCIICHGTLGGWDGSTYEATMTTGDNAPVVIPGNAENSLLAQKLLGTHEEGAIMPPAGKMPDDVIQIILDWIAAGALE